MPMTPQATRSPELLNEIADRFALRSARTRAFTLLACCLHPFPFRDHLDVHEGQALAQRTNSSKTSQCLPTGVDRRTYSISADQRTFGNSHGDSDLTEQIAHHIAEVAPVSFGTCVTSVLGKKTVRWTIENSNRSSLLVCCMDWNEPQRWRSHWTDRLVRERVSRNDCWATRWSLSLRSPIHPLSNEWWEIGWKYRSLITVRFLGNSDTAECRKRWVRLK